MHHQRRLELVQSDERKVPLTYQWVGDMLLNEFLESMSSGDDELRRTPALVFCFNRDDVLERGRTGEGQEADR